MRPVIGSRSTCSIRWFDVKCRCCRSDGSCSGRTASLSQSYDVDVNAAHPQEGAPLRRELSDPPHRSSLACQGSQQGALGESALACLPQSLQHCHFRNCFDDEQAEVLAAWGKLHGRVRAQRAWAVSCLRHVTCHIQIVQADLISICIQLKCSRGLHGAFAGKADQITGPCLSLERSRSNSSEISFDGMCSSGELDPTALPTASSSDSNQVRAWPCMLASWPMCC